VADRLASPRRRISPRPDAPLVLQKRAILGGKLSWRDRDGDILESGSMRFEIERVRAMYREAEPGIALLAQDARYTVRLALDLYRGILEPIEANAYDVFSRRAYVPFRRRC
jgi:hypothetical protein